MQLDLFAAAAPSEIIAGVTSSPVISAETVGKISIAASAASPEASACHIRRAACIRPGKLTATQGGYLRNGAAWLRRFAANGLFAPAMGFYRPEGVSLTGAEVLALAGEMERLANLSGDKTNSAWIAAEPIRYIYSSSTVAVLAAGATAEEEGTDEEGDESDDEEDEGDGFSEAA